MISTVDLTRKGLLRVIGYLEVTQLPAPERFDAAINDLVSWVEDHPDDLDRFFAETPVSYPKWEATVNLAPITEETTPVNLADYDHAGFRQEVTASASAYRDWHNDPHHNDLP